MILSALPRFTIERYAQMFADRPIPATSTFLRVTKAEAASPDFAITLAGIKANGTKRIGMRYVGAFVLTDAEPDPEQPDAKLVAFTFVMDPPTTDEDAASFARMDEDVKRAQAATDAANEVCPRSFWLDDAGRITVEGFSQRFAGTDCCHFELLWPIAPETVRPTLLHGFAACFQHKPGCIYRGAFHLTDAQPNPDNPKARLVAFTFVKD